MKLTEYNKGTGAIPSTKDKRDFQYEKIAGFSPFDWTKGYDIETVIGRNLPVKDQGTSYSCGGQAWATYGNALISDNHSAKFIYAQTFVQGGGSAGRTNCDLVKNQGWGLEFDCVSLMSSLPPDEIFMERPQDISDTARKNAVKSYSYASVLTDIESVANAIVNNKGCVIGVSGKDNGTWLSAYPAIPTGGGSLWRHWLYAGKLKSKDGKRYVGVLNSWGSNVGESGWQWLHEDFFNNGFIFEAWVIVYSALPKHTFYTPLKYMQTGTEVVWLQKCLQSIGYFPKEQECTGYYGDISRQAVFKFQKDHCITGPVSWLSVWYGLGNNVGPLSLTALNKLFSTS